MLYATNELRLERRQGKWGTAICLVLAVLAIAILSRDAMGQERDIIESFDLIGHVIDGETGEALVGAYVSFTGSDWISVSNEEGRFAILDVDEGSVSLSAEQLGYESLVWEGEVDSDGVLVELRMVPKPIILEGLKVVTDRFESRRRSARSTVVAYDRADLVTTKQRTALDFIAQRLGSTRELCTSARGGDICLRLRGRTVEPTVWVDEAPVMGGRSYLEAIPPYELQMIEVYGHGRHVRAYTPAFMARAAEIRLTPIALSF
jgi:hypothetical protein